jgi:hypothetical protein
MVEVISKNFCKGTQKCHEIKQSAWFVPEQRFKPGILQVRSDSSYRWTVYFVVQLGSVLRTELNPHEVA